MEATGTSGVSTCRIAGTLNAASGEVQRLEALCPSSPVQFLGQFAIDTDSGKIVGRTKTRQGGENIDVVWTAL
jgi:hypothetical protein